MTRKHRVWGETGAKAQCEAGAAEVGGSEDEHEGGPQGHAPAFTGVGAPWLRIGKPRPSLPGGLTTAPLPLGLPLPPILEGGGMNGGTLGAPPLQPIPWE